jgi:low affinity Fe/Cu permease
MHGACGRRQQSTCQNGAPVETPAEMRLAGAHRRLDVCTFGDGMDPGRTRASETQPYRERIMAIARLAGAHRKTVGTMERLATAATNWTGHNIAFIWALALVVTWIASGPLFHYSDTWQLFINTVTSLATFLMVFLIQRSQNKDTMALQLKLNELIAAQKGAHNSLIAIEQFSEDELRALHDRFVRLAEMSHGGTSTSVASVSEKVESAC